MRLPVLLTLGPIWLAVTSCVTAPQTGPFAKPEPSDHDHVRPTAKNAGDWHVANFMNQRASKIGVQILSRHEAPYYLGEAKLKASVSRPQQEPVTIWLIGEGYEAEPLGIEEYSGQRSAATVYSARLPWVKDAHEAQLTVWIPLPDGRTYELDFRCVAETPSATHSGH